MRICTSRVVASTALGRAFAGWLLSFAAVLALAGPVGHAWAQTATQAGTPAGTKTAVEAGVATGDHERWFKVLLADAQSGWMHAQVKTDGDLQTSTSEMRLSIKRGPIELKIRILSEYVENKDGTLVSAKQVSETGSAPVETVATFAPDQSAEVVTRQGGLESKRSVAAPTEPWMAPGAAGRFALEQMREGKTEVTVRTIDLSSGLSPITMKRTDIKRVETSLFGRPVQGYSSKVEVSIMPGVKSEELLDDQGIPISSVTPLGGMRMSLIASSREEAMGATSEMAPELMISTLVRPDRPIKNSRTSTKAVYVLKTIEGAMPDLPSDGAQRVERINDSSVRVRVDLAAPAPTTDDPKAYLGSSTFVNINDDVIKALAKKAVEGAAPDAASRAEAIRRFVFEFIREKSLGVAYATASDVARKPEGDCSEHGVLLAALLRANGIPARVVAGMMYADEFVGQEGIFGYHMWAQAMLEVDGEMRWIDLDGVLPPGQASDATHIALGYSALSDDEPMNGLLTLTTIFGRLGLTVESCE